MDFNEFQQQVIKRVNNYVSSNNFKQICDDEFPVKNILAAWNGTINCNNIPVDIVLALPNDFPDVLPKIYLAHSYFFQPIPHIDENLFVCTFPGQGIDFFVERTETIIDQIIEKAREIITDGIIGKNKGDFLDEFLAYWCTNDTISAYSIFSPTQETKILYLANLTLNFGKREVIADSKEDLINLQNTRGKPKSLTFQPVLYLPFEQSFFPPFPSTNKDIIELVESCQNRYIEDFRKFYIQSETKPIIAFSIPINDSPVIAGWVHERPNKKILSRGGFRLHKADTSSIFTLIKSRLGSTPIKKFCVDRLDSNRIQKRVGNPIHHLSNKKICLVGCGSLGSKIAFKLAEAGVSELILIDDESLRVENIGRHECGFSYVGKSKVNAIQESLYARFPTIKITPISCRFNQAYLENIESINECELIVSTTGNTALERRLNQLKREHQEFPTVVYSWIEPYGIAGHAVLIQDTNHSCFECTLNPSDLSYIYRVVTSNPEIFTFRENGCQTWFTPYSGLDSDQLSIATTRLIIQFLSDEITQNTRILSLGDLNKATDLGLDIADEYDLSQSLTITSHSIIRNPNCTICQQPKYV